MPFEKFDFESLSAERRKAAASSIRAISVEELEKLGQKIFPVADDPWRDAFFGFIAEHRNSTFHYATTNDGVHVLYTVDFDKGMWFMPGIGKGPLQAGGRKAMKEIIETGR